MATKIECVVGRVVSGRDCAFCGNDKSAVFSGLKVTYENGRGLYVVRPYQVRKTAGAVFLNWGTNSVAVTLTETDYATIDDLVDVVSGCNYASVSSTAPAGIFDSDPAAAAGGVSIGDLYELSLANIYGLPAGSLKIRRE